MTTENGCLTRRLTLGKGLAATDPRRRCLGRSHQVSSPHISSVLLISHSLCNHGSGEEVRLDATSTCESARQHMLSHLHSCAPTHPLMSVCKLTPGLETATRAHPSTCTHHQGCSRRPRRLHSRCTRTLSHCWSGGACMLVGFHCMPPASLETRDRLYLKISSTHLLSILRAWNQRPGMPDLTPDRDGNIYILYHPIT